MRTVNDVARQLESLPADSRESGTVVPKLQKEIFRMTALVQVFFVFL